MEITIGWWALPTALTVAAFVFAIFMIPNEKHGGDYNFGAIGDALIGVLWLGGATTFSLIAWLVYAFAV